MSYGGRFAVTIHNAPPELADQLKECNTPEGFAQYVPDMLNDTLAHVLEYEYVRHYPVPFHDGDVVIVVYSTDEIHALLRLVENGPYSLSVRELPPRKERP